MTKRNLLLVSLLLVCGLAATASSMFAVTGIVFYGSNNTNYFMRAEGDAEATGTITLSTTSTGTIKAGSAFYITYNAPISNNGASAYSVGVTCLGDFAGTVCPAITPFSIGTNAFVSTPPYPVQGTPAKNEVILMFNTDVVLTAPTVGTSINVAVRVKIQNYPYNYVLVATVRAYYQYSQFPMTVNPLYNAAYTVGQIGPSQALTLGFKEGPAHVLTCIGVKDIDYFDNDFSLRFTENWPNALTSLSDEYNLENDTVAPAPSNGSNLLVTFKGMPPGVSIAEDHVYSCAQYPSGPHGCPGGALSVSYTSNSGAPVCSGSPSLCTQWFHFQVDATNTGVVEGGVLFFRFWSDGPLPPNQGLLGQIWATVSLTDLEETAVPPDMPYFTTAETPELSVVEFSDCVTKLLFPYINTYQANNLSPFSHFGTGIDFANTTWDPWNPTLNPGVYPDEEKGSAVPQSGSCSVYLYPADESTTQVFVTPTISAGGSFAFDVASSVPGFAGQTGYAIAVCGFQNAYGFAEIYDNFGPLVGYNDPGATLGYLAYIIPNPAFYHRSPAGDGLGESAIAPLAVDKFIQKMLFYGVHNAP